MENKQVQPQQDSQEQLQNKQIQEAEELNKQAGQFYLKHQIFAAINLYDKAIELDPQNKAKYLLNKAACNLEQGSYFQCLTELQEAENLHNSGKSILKEQQLQKLQQRRQKASECNQINESLLLVQDQFIQNFKKSQDKGFDELLDDLELQDITNEQLQQQQQNNNNINEANIITNQQQQSEEEKQKIQKQNQEKYNNLHQKFIQGTRGQVQYKNFFEFYQYSHSQPASLIYDSLAAKYYDDIKDLEHFQFVHMGCTDLRIMLHTLSDFMLYQQQDNLQQVYILKENFENKLKSFKFMFNDINQQTFTRNMFSFYFIFKISLDIQKINELKEQKDFLYQQIYALYGLWFNVGIYQDQKQIIVQRLQEFKNDLNNQNSEFNQIANYNTNTKNIVNQELNRWLDLLQNIPNLKQYIIDIIPQVNKQKVGEYVDDLQQGKINPEKFFQDDYFDRTKIIPPIQRKNKEKFLENFKQIELNFTLYPKEIDNENFLGKFYNQQQSEYETKDLQNNPQTIRRIQKMEKIPSTQDLLPHLAEEDDFCPKFNFSSFDADLEQLRQYVLSFISMHKILNQNLKFEFYYGQAFQQLEEIGKNQEYPIYNIFWNNIPDYYNLMYCLLKTFKLCKCLHFRHDIMLFPGAFDFSREAEGSGQISMMLMEGLGDYKSKYAKQNVRRYLYAMFKCLSFEEVQDILGFQVDKETKYQSTRNSYTQNAYNQWDQVDYYKISEINSNKRQRFNQWIADIFLECMLPGKRIFEEKNIGQMQKMSPIPSPLQAAFFIEILDWVIRLRRYPIHLVLDFLKEIMQNGQLPTSRNMLVPGLPLDPVSEKYQGQLKKIKDVSYLQLDLEIVFNRLKPFWINDIYNIENQDNINITINISIEQLQFYLLYYMYPNFPVLGAILISEKNYQENQKQLQFYSQEQLIEVAEKINKNTENNDYINRLNILSQIENTENGLQIHMLEKYYKQMVENKFKVIFLRVDFWRILGNPIDIEKFKIN